jgi:hypothetical protein
MLDLFKVLLDWIGVPMGKGKTHGVAFALAVPIFIFFGVLLVATGWRGTRDIGWSLERVGALVILAGVLLVVSVAVSVVSFLRAR